MEIPFAWLFAIIVGGFILFLAIFAATKITDTEEEVIGASASKEIGILLNPLEIGFESAKTTFVTLQRESRVYNRCDNDGNFGNQMISVSQKSLDKWTKPSVNVSFQNKYIFSEEFVEGRTLLIFSKPFEFPFKIADVVYITSSKKQYCFVDPPKEISDELSNLNQQNIFIEDCPETSEKVCFSGDCEIKVNFASKYVEKNSERMYFPENSLMYAAIFSDPSVYECQVKRLAQRGEKLVDLYIEKEISISGRNCKSNLNGELSLLKSTFGNVDKSVNINTAVVNEVERLKEKNEASLCRLW